MIVRWRILEPPSMCGLFSHCRLTLGDPFPPLAAALIGPLVLLGGGWRLCPLTACGWRAQQLESEGGQLVHGEVGATGECRRQCGFAGRGYLAAAWDRRVRLRLGRGIGRRRSYHFPGCDAAATIYTIQTSGRLISTGGPLKFLHVLSACRTLQLHCTPRLADSNGGHAALFDTPTPSPTWSPLPLLRRRSRPCPLSECSSATQTNSRLATTTAGTTACDITATITPPPTNHRHHYQRQGHVVPGLVYIIESTVLFVLFVQRLREASVLSNMGRRVDPTIHIMSSRLELLVVGTIGGKIRSYPPSFHITPPPPPP